MYRPHPMQGRVGRRGTRFSRREFLRTSAGAALTVPSLSAILAACGNPREEQATGFQVATPDNPVTLPMVGEQIADCL